MYSATLKPADINVSQINQFVVTKWRQSLTHRNDTSISIGIDDVSRTYFY